MIEDLNGSEIGISRGSSLVATDSEVKDYKKKTRLAFDISNIIGGNKVFCSTVNSYGAIEQQTVRFVRYEFPIDIFGDTFYFSFDGEGYYIYHKKWSVLGEGKDLKEAIQDLLKTVKVIRKQLVDAEPDSLDQAASQFKDYLLHNLSV